MPPLFVIVGAPGVGKSTISRSLATAFDRAVHIPVDDLRDMVVSGIELPRPDAWPPALAEQVRLARETALDAARRYRSAGFAVVIDDFLDPPGLVEYRHVDAVLTVLNPTIDVAIERNRGRERDPELTAYLESGIRQVYAELERQGPALRTAGWELLDTTALGVEETVARIVQRSVGTS